MSMDYIRKTYGVPAKRGGTVRYTPPLHDPRKGTIVGSRDAYLRVRLDGEKRTVFLHPTWCVEYV